VTVHKAGQYCTVYVGDGQKHGDSSFNPIEPPDVMADPSDQIEMPEPTPLEAPEEPAEPDTDGKDGDDNEDDD